jgi:hypothetical protein
MRNLVVALMVLGGVSGCDKLFENMLGKRKAKASVVEAIPATFSESYVSPHKLVTARFPPGFTTGLGGKNGIILSRNLDDGSDEAISILCIADPISQESAAFAKVVLDASTSKLNNYKQLTTRTTTCNGVPGATEVTGTWSEKSSGRVLFRRACAFTRRGHGYSYGYSIPQDFAIAHGPLFQAIVEATQFND